MWNRRHALRALAAAGAYAALRPSTVRAQPGATLSRPIPSTGELLPVVGLGSWITFNVGDDTVARDACADVMHNFVEAGGRMIDSSPMYGSSQDVIGYGLRKAALNARIFSADKVWISSGAQGREQIERSRRKWQVSRFDLVQVHNLLNWQEHLPTLFAMKGAGQVRYVGITTSEGRRHRDVEQLMRSQAIDFVRKPTQTREYLRVDRAYSSALCIQLLAPRRYLPEGLHLTPSGDQIAPTDQCWHVGP